MVITHALNEFVGRVGRGWAARQILPGSSHILFAELYMQTSVLTDFKTLILGKIIKKILWFLVSKEIKRYLKKLWS